MLKILKPDEINPKIIDVHYTLEYMKLYENYLGWEAVYALYNDVLLLPFFKRPVPNTDYFDIIGPWYFGGPHISIVTKGLMSGFVEEFHDWCVDNNVVSEFHRLNPLLENHKHYPEKNVFYDREVVYVDLSKTLETLKNEYSRHARKNINKAKREGLVVTLDDDEENQNAFKKLYTKNMEDKETNKFYFFNKEFFNKLLNDFNSQLFSVWSGGKIICSSLALGSKQDAIIYDYLRGTDTKQLNKRPNDIVLDKTIMWAKKQGYKYFVIGGGNTTDPGDGQLRFKKSFSGTTKPFYVYKKIHNKKVYDDLCKAKEIKEPRYEEASYFPEYAR